MSKNTSGYFYDQRKIHRLFGLSSLALMGATLGMIWQDHHREWKDYQQAARDMEIARLRAEREARSQQIDPAALKAVQEQMAAAAKTLEAKAAAVGAAEASLHGRRTVWYKIDQDFRAAKARVDAARYILEEARHHGEETAAPAAALAARQKESADLRLDQEKAQEAVTQAQAS